MEKERTISIVCIGDELLIGQVTDTNSGDIARHIELYGWKVASVQICGDEGEKIRQAIRQAFSQSDIVITTGGLGPTKDDITKEVLCREFGGTLKEDESVLENVKVVVEKRGLKMNPLTAAQAMVPTSCRVIQNRVGTAPVMWFEKDGKILVAMPGVPFEAREMFRSKVFPRLMEEFPSENIILHRTVIAAGISESALSTKLDDFENNLPREIHLAYLPKPGIIRLRLDGNFSANKAEDGKQMMDSCARELIGLTGENFLYAGDKTPAEILLEELKARKLTVATAESCTGGSIAAALTAIPGASEAFLCGIVAYSNKIKESVLNVSTDTLINYGAVSVQTVREMARGARKVSGADIAMATSGVAGPGGGTPKKPVGTVAIAVSTPLETYADFYHFPGDRQRVIERSVTVALVNAIRHLRAEFPLTGK